MSIDALNRSGLGMLSEIAAGAARANASSDQAVARAIAANEAAIRNALARSQRQAGEAA